jgi:hypothetical protein
MQWRIAEGWMPARAFCMLLLPLVACEHGLVAPTTPAVIDRSEATSTLRLEVEPRVAHVYVRDASTRKIVAVCTHECDLKVPGGRFRVAAGLRHAELAEYDQDIVVMPGGTVDLHVRARDRLPRLPMAALAFTGLAASAAGLTIGTVDQLVAEHRFDRLAGGLFLGGLGGAVVVLIVAVTVGGPTVDVDRSGR